MSHQHQRKTTSAHPQKRHANVAAGDDWQHARSSNVILQLQRTIGNQAVQRLIQRKSDAPAGSKNDKGKTKEFPGYVARIVGHSGNLEGSSTIPGYEGKIEVYAISYYSFPGMMRVTFTKHTDGTSQQFVDLARTGEHVKVVQFTIIRRNDTGEIMGRPLPEYTDGLVSEVQVGSRNDGDEAAYDVVSIDFPEKPKEQDKKK